MAARSASKATLTTTLPESVLGQVILVTGKEEFLRERVAAHAKAQVRATDAEAEISDANAADLTLGELDALSAPSLFTATRCVVVHKLEELPEESVPALLDYATAPVPDVAVVLVHSGGQKGSGFLTKLRKIPAVSEVVNEALKPSELLGFATAEAKLAGGRLEREAAETLIEAIGHDLRSLSAAARQLASDFAGQPITAQVVGRYFAGRAEAKSFAVADHAFFGRRAPALEELRWALDSGTPPVLVTSAFAGSARGLAKLVGAPRGMRDNDLARAVGVPPWKLRTLRDQARGWQPEGLGAAVRAVAQADADIKGAASDAAYTLERLVLTIAALRTGR